MNKVEDITVNGGLHWHPFFESAYYGGGFALGAGYMHHVSSYNLVDVRGSYSILGYKRAEAEFIAPRLFHRRGDLVAPRWLARGDAGRLLRHSGRTRSKDDRTNYGFQRAVRVGDS